MTDADSPGSPHPSTTVAETLGTWLAPSDFERRIPEYWSWIAVALFLLIGVDLLTTSFAVQQFGLAAEGNPVMKWLFVQGPAAVLATHLGAAVIAAVLCMGILESIRRTDDPLRTKLALVFELWIGSLVSLGLFLFANNVSAIVMHASLV